MCFLFILFFVFIFWEVMCSWDCFWRSLRSKRKSLPAGGDLDARKFWVKHHKVLLFFTVFSWIFVNVLEKWQSLIVAIVAPKLPEVNFSIGATLNKFAFILFTFKKKKTKICYICTVLWYGYFHNFSYGLFRHHKKL